MAMGRVYILGTGVVSPLGHGATALWEALASGRSAARVRPFLRETQSPYRVAATIDDFDGKHWIKPRKAIKVMSSPIQFGCAAAQMALDECHWQPGRVAAERFAVVVGSNSIYADPPEMANAFARCLVDGQFDIRRWGQEFSNSVPPLWMLQYLPNMAASHFSIGQDARGPSNSICQENCSSLLAMIEAALLLQRNWADLALAGGTGSLTSLTGMVYRGIDTLTRRVAEPLQVPCPFAADSDGQVIGEGAGILVLANEMAAQQIPEARRLGVIRGWARGFCRPQVDAPQFLAQLIQEALRHAELRPQDIGHIDAHATGMPTTDRWESQAIADTLPQVPVVAWKSYFGNLGAGSGAVEVIASLKALHAGRLLPTLHTEQVADDCPIRLLRHSQSAPCRPFVKISLDPTGQMVVVIIEPCEVQ